MPLHVRQRRQRDHPRHLLRRRGDGALFPQTVAIRHSTKTDEYTQGGSPLLWFCHIARSGHVTRIKLLYFFTDTLI